MRNKIVSKGKFYKKSRVGILLGIPLLLFLSGITLISVSAYKNFKFAFYFYSIFVHEEYKPVVANKVETGTSKIKYPSFGEKFGQLSIPSAQIDYPVYNGDTEEQLLKGIGHYFGSTYPGEDSNVVLAAHRNSLFKNLKYVKVGDQVIFNTTYGKYVYQITEIKIVSGKDTSIVQPTDSERLTLYTCYPFDYIGNAPQRFVAICKLVEGTPLKELIQKQGGN